MVQFACRMVSAPGLRLQNNYVCKLCGSYVVTWTLVMLFAVGPLAAAASSPVM